MVDFICASLLVYFTSYSFVTLHFYRLFILSVFYTFFLFVFSPLLWMYSIIICDRGICFFLLQFFFVPCVARLFKLIAQVFYVLFVHFGSECVTSSFIFSTVSYIFWWSVTMLVFPPSLFIFNPLFLLLYLHRWLSAFFSAYFLPLLLTKFCFLAQVSCRNDIIIVWLRVQSVLIFSELNENGVFYIDNATQIP